MRGNNAGNDWGDIFATAINGIHLQSPLGIVDIALGNTAWSAKTVTNGNPVTARNLRLISGRNNVGYSFGNNEPLSDIHKTGNQVLEIWNARVEEAMQQYSHLRTIILIRDMENFRFKIFEQPVTLYDPADYAWNQNKGNNLIGKNIQDDTHVFTWQPNGSQFTIHRRVSGSARAFQIRKPVVHDYSEHVFATLGYSEDWVEFL